MESLAAAPTGIAAANIEIEGTDICAATLHSVFDLDGVYESKIDFTKPGADKAAAILKMKVLLMSCMFVRVKHADTFVYVHSTLHRNSALRLRTRKQKKVLFLEEVPQF